MSTPSEATPRKSSNAGRYFFMLLLGLVLGIIGTVMAIRSWQAKQDHFPDSVMTVQSWHMGQLKKNVEQNRCTANETLPHLQTLRRMADDIEPAFGEDAKDERFAKHAANFRAALDTAQSNPPLSCESLKATMGEVGSQCKACHDDFKKS